MREGASLRHDEPLSEREYEVLELVAFGLSKQEIGRHLMITTKTVKKHLEHIYTKLDVHSRTAALARMRLSHGQPLVCRQPSKAL